MTRHDAPRLLPSPLRLPAAAWIFLAVALLGAWSAAPAPAANPPHAFAPQAFEPGEGEGEEEGETEEELELEIDEEGEWLEVEEEGGEEESTPASILPPECLLRAARPRAIIDSAHERLRLVLAFKAWNATKLDASFRLEGPHGTLRLDGRTRRPSRVGTIRLSRDLASRAFEKALAAHLVVVRLVVPATPPYCHLTMRLSPTRR